MHIKAKVAFGIGRENNSWNKGGTQYFRFRRKRAKVRSIHLIIQYTNNKIMLQSHINHQNKSLSFGISRSDALAYSILLVRLSIPPGFLASSKTKEISMVWKIFCCSLTCTQGLSLVYFCTISTAVTLRLISLLRAVYFQCFRIVSLFLHHRKLSGPISWYSYIRCSHRTKNPTIKAHSLTWSQCFLENCLNLLFICLQTIYSFSILYKFLLNLLVFPWSMQAIFQFPPPIHAIIDSIYFTSQTFQRFAYISWLIFRQYLFLLWTVDDTYLNPDVL